MRRSQPPSFWHQAADRARAAGAPLPASGQQLEKPRKPLRRDPPPLPKALVPTDDVLRLRLAEELEYARRMLDIMGDELAADSTVVMRHTRALQSVDIVGQMLGHLAGIIRSSDPDGAIELVGMAELKARLQRKGSL